MVGIKKKRADVGIGPYKIVAFAARAKASRFCPAMPFLIPAGGLIMPYTVGAATCRLHGKKKKADLTRNRLLVDTKGVEPSTSAMRMQHSPN